MQEAWLGPVQTASALAWEDDIHVDKQRAIYESRLETLLDLFQQLGYIVNKPEGAFYLWAKSDKSDCWSILADLAKEFGVIVTLGDFLEIFVGRMCVSLQCNLTPIISLLQEEFMVETASRIYTCPKVNQNCLISLI